MVPPQFKIFASATDVTPLNGGSLEMQCKGLRKWYAHSRNLRVIELRNPWNQNDGEYQIPSTYRKIHCNSFYISIAMGFSTGFWVFWGSLILIASWRHAYFRFLSNMNDRI
ncbi:transmembrane protein, putative [Medicago truncatula]|uniref:Transmembrane protein, putative n=1 Tax=Medicago truncatula TaxID=3880 RepID=G7L9I7_MEDTR|nr:transmembrane protein, putative [Medicago truncatula]